MCVDVACDVLHFFGQQRTAVNFGEPQRAARKMDVRRESMQRATVFGAIGK